MLQYNVGANMKLYQYVKNIQNQSENNFYENNKTSILDEINKIIEDNYYDDLLLIISNEKFYDILIDLYYDLHQENIAKTFLANFWYKKLISIPKELQADFLNLIVSEKVDTFSILGLFEHFMSNKFDLSAEFFVDWFNKLGELVKNDYCANLFYNGIIPFTKNNKELAFNVLQELLNKEYSIIIHNLFSIILGFLRAENFDKIDDLDNLLQKSEKITYQKFYYSSLVNTFFDTDVDEKELSRILDEILNKKNKELEPVAFFMTWKIFSSTKKNNIKNFIIEWLNANTNDNLTDLSKYYCVQIAQDNDEYIDDINKILTNIQPINPKNKGTYEILSFVFSKLLTNYSDKFNELLSAILIKNDLSELLNDEHFINILVTNINKEFFTKLFISKNLNQRKFAQEIYVKNSDKIHFNNDILLTMDDKLFELVFKETLLKIHYGNIFSKFFIDFNDCINKVKNENFKTFLDIEISHQCINFPQGCYKTLKSCDTMCNLIKICLKKVEHYFDIINKYKNSPINSFTFSSCNDATLKGLIKQNKKIREGTEKASVFAALCHNIELLYGNKHAHQTDMGISESELFAHMEHSIEIPILSFLNPISEVFKATEIRKEIISLRKEITDEI